jgi:predicted phage tail protein
LENSAALYEYVSGSGGGGGKGKGGGEQPNTLRSLSTLMVLWLLSEGEIVTFTGDELLKRIYIEQTPVMNADGSRNFKEVTYRPQAPRKKPSSRDSLKPPAHPSQ